MGDLVSHRRFCQPPDPYECQSCKIQYLATPFDVRCAFGFGSAVDTTAYPKGMREK